MQTLFYKSLTAHEILASFCKNCDSLALRWLKTGGGTALDGAAAGVRVVDHPPSSFQKLRRHEEFHRERRFLVERLSGF